MVCASCGTENSDTAKFCNGCGAPLARTCPSCGTSNPGSARFCSECGAQLLPETTPAARPAPATERRLVSVLFADLVGFTTLSESRDAEQVRELLSRYFDTCSRIISLYGGMVEKFIGDAVMAVWGTPTATEDDAERAVRAALDLVAAVSALGQEIGAEELRARAGVLTGEAAVTLGAVGEGMVAGDLVNSASRVQALAEPGTVYVGESTRLATDPTIVYEEAGSFELKGKAGRFPLWAARRVVSGLRGSLKSEGLEAPFVGRDRELRQIKDLFHTSADERRAQLVSVTGIAGIGKSRLSWEFYKYFDGIADSIYWHRGRCLPYGDGVTYWALADMVRMRCRVTEDEQPHTALEKLRATLDEHLLDPEERRFVEPRLAHLLGVGDHKAPDRQDLFAAWRLFFERLAETYPTVLVFEDMQWADESLLDFVEYLLDWSRSHALFVVTLARPDLLDRRPTWGAGQRSFMSLYLEPLSAKAMHELLDGLVPGLPAELRDRILERAEGVPLYAVETVRMLLGRGLLVREGSAYRPVGEIDALDVPETLHALIAARLDSLAPEERALLQDAAVLGKTFTPQALVAVSGLDAERVSSLLTGLVRKETLGQQADPRSPEHGQYGFLQDLVRHVAYETLSRRERRARHLAAAAHLASASATEDELTEVIASHLVDAYEAVPDADDAAELKQRAREMLGRAGERAASLAAAAEARRYFEQATALADDPLDRAHLLLRAGHMAGNAADPDGAAVLLNQAIELYEAAGDTHGAARASARLGFIQSFIGRRDEVIAMLERAYAVIADDEPDEGLGQLAALLSRGYWFRGEIDRSDEYANLALDVAESQGFPGVLCMALRAKGAVELTRGHEEVAGALLEHALAIALEHDLAHDGATASFMLSDKEFRRDRYEASLAHLQTSLALARKIGSRPYEWAALAEMTYPLFMLGRWDEALALLPEPTEEQTRSGGVVLSLLDSHVGIHVARGDLDEAERVFALFSHLERSTDRQDRSTYFAGRATIHHAHGRYAEAVADTDLVIEASRSLGYGDQGTKQAVPVGFDAAVASGDLDKAREFLAVFEDRPEGRRAPVYRAHAERFRARLDGQLSLYESAVARFREFGLQFLLAQALLEHAEALAAADRGDDAAPLLAEARDLFEQLGVGPWLTRLRASAELVPAD